MADLTTTYMGLKLRNPLIIGSCGLTASVNEIKRFEEMGAGAVVIKSIFEEQIRGESGEIGRAGTTINSDNEARDYIYYYVRQNNLDNYLKLIREVKKSVSIPVIASVNCTSLTEWPPFTHTVENAGADALEINVFVLPADETKKSEEIEGFYFNLVKEVSKHVNIPFSLKIGTYFSGMANTLVNLAETGVSAMVLFNRFFSPDVDVEEMEVTSSNIYSLPEDIAMPLRWTGILSDKLECDISATTGVHDGEAMIKLLLAGATTVQIATILYQKGPEVIKSMLDTLSSWMDRKGFFSIDEFRGRCSQSRIKRHDMYERAQFMKYFSDHR